jgi:WD40 repeat protein
VLGLGATSEGAGVISVNRAGQILIWEAEGPPSHSIHVADEPSLTAINADRGLVAVWPDRNGDIALVDISVGAVYRHIPAHLHQATHLTFSGLILVVASGFDEELECWDTSSGRRLAVYPLGSSVQAVAAAADGGILAADLDHNLYWLRVSLPPSTIETPPD